MTNDPMYSKMEVENDFQVAIDQNHSAMLLKLLKEDIEVTFECSMLPLGQPHSCDNTNEVWGNPRLVINQLHFKKCRLEIKLGSIEVDNGVATLKMNIAQTDIFIKTLQKALSVPAFFEYEHFIEVRDRNNQLVKINIWGWCQNGQIEYAN